MRESLQYQFLFVLVICFLLSPELRAQDATHTAVVVRVQGRGAYLNVGRELGINPDDTLSVQIPTEDRSYVRVIGSSTGSSLVTWLGRQLEVAEGDTLMLFLPRLLETSGDTAESVLPAERRALMETPVSLKREGRPARRPRFRGSIQVSFNGMRSKSGSRKGGSGDDYLLFSTPTFAFRGAVSDLPGETTLSVHARASHRYSSGDIFDRPNSFRIYQVSISRILPGSGFGMQVGRFSNRHEPESGYWDGLLLQQRGRFLEFGLAAGLEPDRFDEGFRSDLPKYSAYAILRPRLGDLRWNTNLSFSQMRPANEWSTHSYFGLDQRIQLSVLTLATDIQVDRDPASEEWTMSRFRSRLNLRLFSALSIQARHSVRRPYSYWRTEQVFSYRREQSSLGLSLSSDWMNWGLNVTRNAIESDTDAYTYSMNVGVPQIPVLKLGVNAVASYWSRQVSQTTYASVSLSKQIAASRLQILYSMYRADLGSAIAQSHTIGAAVQLPLRKNIQFSLQGRTFLGRDLTSTTVYASIWMSI